MLSDEDADQERAVVALVGDVLDDDVAGIYRHGSAATDDLQWCSDLDLLVVTGRALTHARRHSLVHGLLPLSGPEPGTRPRPVELTVVVAPDVRPWRYPPHLELQYGEWMHAEMLADPAVTGPHLDPDLAVLLSAARQHSVALAGPPAPTLLDPIPPSDLRRSNATGLPGLLAELHTDTRNVVLTLARMVVTAETGAIVSKLAAADHVLPRLSGSEQDVLALARAAHTGERPELPHHLPGLEDFATQMQIAIDHQRRETIVSRTPSNRSPRRRQSPIEVSNKRVDK